MIRRRSRVSYPQKKLGLLKKCRRTIRKLGRFAAFACRMIAFDLNGFRRSGLVAIGRGACLGEKLEIELGARVWIGPYAVLQGNGRLEIKRDTYVGSFFSVSTVSSVVIGECTMIANAVSMVDNNHGMDTNRDMCDQPVNTSPISIGRNCWIGDKVTILSGVRIGDGAVVAAGAVVTKDVPEDAIVVGVPAHVLRYRVALDTTDSFSSIGV